MGVAVRKAAGALAGHRADSAKLTCDLVEGLAIQLQGCLLVLSHGIEDKDQGHQNQ
jgi:hypothetical protein